MYKPVLEVYGKETTEKDRPTLQSSAEKGSHGMPFNPSGQFARNVGEILHCTECNKPRVMYAARKVRFYDQRKLETVLEGIIYTCGMDLKECIPADISDHDKQSHVLSSIFVRQNMNCDSRIEIPYFSSECFPSICIYCGSEESLVPAIEMEGMYPLCSSCKATTPGILKRKRKLCSS